MAIETYLIEESEKMIAEPEHLEEWQKSVEELGLEGQKQLAKPDKSPIPFPKMKSTEYRVYETLCPNKTEVKKYSSNTIPLRVLSLIALAQREEYFAGIEIWDDDTKPDPIAVGFTDASAYAERKNYYIIARWGDELRSFVELRKMAEDRLTVEKRNDLQKRLSDLDNNICDYFNGKWVNF